jgi:hypothetical protein
MVLKKHVKGVCAGAHEVSNPFRHQPRDTWGNTNRDPLIPNTMMGKLGPHTTPSAGHRSVTPGARHKARIMVVPLDVFGRWNSQWVDFGGAGES